MGLTTIEPGDERSLYERAAEQIVKDVKAVVAAHGNCIIGIVGGHTEPGVLSALASRMKGIPGRIEVFWLDERVDGEKNYLPALPYLQKMRSSMVQIFWHPLKGTNPDTAAQEANKTLQHMDALGRKREFDIVILSSGEDGHIASLFPKNKALAEKEAKYVLVEHSPKPPATRVSVSPPLLLTAKHAYLFFVGRSKQKAYISFLDSGTPMRECPERMLTKIPHLTLCLHLK